ncbi:TorF family putative porin [Thalassotalea ganghwensis]
MTKNALTIIIASTLLMSYLSSTEVKAESLTANVGVTSNYLWRGMEQTGGSSAVYGGIDYSADSGFYAGMWASNASWADGMTYELDLYGGFTGNISETVSFDVGYVYFGYPDEASGDAEFSEIYANVSFEGLTLGAAVLVEGEGGDFADTLYLSADYGFSLTNEAEVSLHIGSYTGDWLAEDMIDYGVSISKSGFTLGASKTDLEDDDLKLYVSYSVDIAL